MQFVTLGQLGYFARTRRKSWWVFVVGQTH